MVIVASSYSSRPSILSRAPLLLPPPLASARPMRSSAIGRALAAARAFSRTLASHHPASALCFTLYSSPLKLAGCSCCCCFAHALHSSRVPGASIVAVVQCSRCLFTTYLLRLLTIVDDDTHEPLLTSHAAHVGRRAPSVQPLVNDTRPVTTLRPVTTSPLH